MKKGICIIAILHSATCALIFKVASLFCKIRVVPCTLCSWVCPGLGFFRGDSSRCAIIVAMTKLRDVVMLLQLPKWEVFFSIFLLGFKPLTKSVLQKAKQASCSGAEKGLHSYPHIPLLWSV